MGQTRKEWLQTVTAQLRCRRAVPGVERELENHLSEQYNAFVAQGCAPEEAERRTVESMGDPVLAGGALDRVHRPRPAWGPFFMVAALLLAGALLRFFWSVPVSAQGVYLWREGAYQSLAAALAGIAVLAAVYFCMDVSLLARWTKALYIGLAAVSAYGFLAGYTLMNGRRLWTVWGVSYDATHFSMIFIPIYAAVVYRQRGRGWAGLLVSGFAIVPGLWLCIMVPHLAAACVLGLAGLAVCLVCCAGDWYGLGGKKSFAVVLGVTAGSLVVTFLLVLLLMPGLAGSLQRHLEVLLAPDANAAGAGYWMNALRRMWDGMRWLGPETAVCRSGKKRRSAPWENLQGRRCGSCAPITCWLTRAGGTVLPAPQRWPQLSRARWHGCGARPCAPAAASGGCARWAAVHCSRCTACSTCSPVWAGVPREGCCPF